MLDFHFSEIIFQWKLFLLSEYLRPIFFRVFTFYTLYIREACLICVPTSCLIWLIIICDTNTYESYAYQIWSLHIPALSNPTKCCVCPTRSLIRQVLLCILTSNLIHQNVVSHRVSDKTGFTVLLLFSVQTCTVNQQLVVSNLFSQCSQIKIITKIYRCEHISYINWNF